MQIVTRYAVVSSFLVAGCAGEADLGYPAPPPPTNAGTADAAVDVAAPVASEASFPPATSFVPGEALFSAAFFIESYCSGCHQPQFVAPSGHEVALFSTDPAWAEPFGNPEWLGALDYATIVKWGPVIRCGVNPSWLPAGCTSLPQVPPGFFTAAQKFPPSGDGTGGDYGQAPPAVCAFAADGHTCPQPSDYDRVQMVAWVDDGSPR